MRVKIKGFEILKHLKAIKYITFKKNLENQ